MTSPPLRPPARTAPGLAPTGPRRLALLLLPFLVLLVLLVLPAAPAGAAAASAPQTLQPAGSGVVREVITGDTLVLTDGRIVRLAGIQAPKVNAGRSRPFKWPLADEARAALEALALGRGVGLHLGTLHQDRHDRVPAQLVRDDGLWLQGELLARGWARVYAGADLATLGDQLYAREASARAARLGIWGLPFYAVRAPEGLGRDSDSFQLVEGRVLAATLARGQLYLNFGPDWRTDFTIRVPRRAVRAFRQLHGEPALLQGRLIRVRGWVYRHNGPEIELIHPEQLERLEPAPAAPAPREPSQPPSHDQGGIEAPDTPHNAAVICQIGAHC
ncbi:MAG: thermonuclease family protein [Rhodospirillaceae bacterium]